MAEQLTIDNEGFLIVTWTSFFTQIGFAPIFSRNFRLNSTFSNKKN